MLALDGAPGGKFNMSNFSGNLPFPVEAIKKSEFCFIPTGSSLALDSWNNLTQTITSSTPKPPYLHASFVQNTNEPHVEYKSSALFLCNLLDIASPTISGSTLICSGSPKTFSSPTNWKQGYYWDKAGNLSLSEPKINPTVTVSAASSSSSGSGYVCIKNSNHVELARFNVWVGPPLISSISGLSMVSPGGYYYYDALVQSSLSVPSSYKWTLNEVGVGYTYQTTPNNYAVFTFYNEGYYQVVCQAVNICGTGDNFATGVYAGSRSSSISGVNIYPNPVGDVLYIEFDQPSSSRTQINYDIRLYDGHGNMLRQSFSKGGIVQFDVTTIPPGIYYLHIYDGVSEKPGIQQIMVER